MEGDMLSLEEMKAIQKQSLKAERSAKKAAKKKESSSSDSDSADSDSSSSGEKKKKKKGKKKDKKKLHQPIINLSLVTQGAVVWHANTTKRDKR